MAISARENSSLRRRSGVRNAAANACSTCPPRVGRVRLSTVDRPASPPPLASSRRDPAAGPCTADDPRGAWHPGGRQCSDCGGAASGGADLLLGGLGEGVRVPFALAPAELAGAEDLDRLTTPDGAGVGQRVRVDRAALRE